MKKSIRITRTRGILLLLLGVVLAGVLKLTLPWTRSSAPAPGQTTEQAPNRPKAEETTSGAAQSVPVPSGSFPGGGLRAHEHSGSHTIRQHVGKTPEDLFNRLRQDRRIAAASSFTDLATAERAIGAVLSVRKAQIDSWLQSGENQVVVSGRAGRPVGISVVRGATAVVPVSGVRIILRKDASMPNGYRIHTAYPER